MIWYFRKRTVNVGYLEYLEKMIGTLFGWTSQSNAHWTAKLPDQSVKLPARRITGNQVINAGCGWPTW